MNKTQYINELKRHLRTLPKEDFQKAVEYYEEYFFDAGVENEAQVIEDLGTPEFAARQIITTIAINNTKEPVSDVKKGFSAVWVGILAICAAPIALPFALVAALFVILFFLMILLFLFCCFIVGVALVLCGLLCFPAGFTMLTTSIPVFISCLGIGFSSLGLGMALCYGMFRLCQMFLKGTVRFCGHLVKKGGKKNEKNQ